MDILETSITKGYETTRVLYLGADPVRDGRLSVGKVTVLINGDSTFQVEGTLNQGGQLSGLSKLYKYLNLEQGQLVKYAINNGSLVIHEPTPPVAGVGTSPTTSQTVPVPGSAAECVFARKKLKHLHIEPFRPENLNNWEPETETDVYLAFGVLQQYTDYQYCCGASIDILRKLGATYTESAKPDAILIDRTTDGYLMAEWKMRSSDYKLNHNPEDVDVLICWIHDETDQKKLPPMVLALKDVARTAAHSNLLAGDPA